jgi:hypothetical protein
MNSKRNSKLKIEPNKETLSSWIFEVTVLDSGGRHILKITLDKEYHKTLTQGKVLPLILVQESVFYLLEREPVTSILSEFNIKEINKYFPKFEDEIKQNLSA